MAEFHILRPARWGWLLRLVMVVLLPVASALPAQGPTGGSLNLTVTGEQGLALVRVMVSVERGGVAFRTVPTDRAGHAGFGALSAGEYTVLIEQFGYQPVRYRGVRIVAGGETRLSVSLERRPPPILSVEERQAQAVIIGGSVAESGPSGDELRRLAKSQDVTDIAGEATRSLSLWDGRSGLFGANGLRPATSALRVDGVNETLLRHPGAPGEPMSTSLFTRGDLGSAQVSSQNVEGRWSGTPGALLDMRTASISGPFAFRPWLALDGGLGARSADNPADSSALGLQGGLTMGGAIKGDTGSWLMRFDVRSIRQPRSAPFADVTTGTGEQLSAEILAAMQAHSTVGSAAAVSPTVRSWSGFSGMGKIDWRFGGRAALGLRASVASDKEENLTVGFEAVNGAGARLESSDHSVAANFVISGNRWVSTTTLGFRGAKRDWFAGELPFTSLSNEGVAFGTAKTLPGKFSERALEFNESGSYRLGAHELRGGLFAQRKTINWDWAPGVSGVYQFGDLNSFQAGQGSYSRATAIGTVPDLAIKETGAFLQDGWQASPALRFTLGVRYDKQQLPDTTGLTSYNDVLQSLSLAHTELLPNGDRKLPLDPYGLLVWSPAGSSMRIEGSAGMVSGSHDLAALSEVVRTQRDGLKVARVTGTLDWPALSSGTTLKSTPSVTLYVPGIRRPRTFKADLGLIHGGGGQSGFSVRAGYRHTDYLLRRTDVNRHQIVPSTGSDNRPIFGDLQQFGGLIVPAARSNHRFAEYDMIYALSGDGFVNQYEVGADVDHRMGKNLSMHLSYTFAQTKDNLVGQLSSDPADRLSPFPSGLAGKDWADGRSDLDVPHRLAATLQFGGGERPFGVSARYRFQSGLPFTPGASLGVDLNGDGSSANDPAFLGSAIPGMSTLVGAHACLGAAETMVKRNACRDPGQHSLDVALSYRMAIGTARHLTVTLDAFDLVGSEIGVRDHAAVRVDPAGTIQRNSSGKVVLPLLANERFGELLSRRGDPRLLRIGFRVEN